MDCYCLLKSKLKSSMVTAERTFPQVSSTSFSIVASLAPGTWVSSYTFLCLHIYVHFFSWRHLSRPALGPPAISHQPSQSWAWSSFSKLPSTLPHSKISTCIAMNCLCFHTLLELSCFSILLVLYTI